MINNCGPFVPEGEGRGGEGVFCPVGAKAVLATPPARNFYPTPSYVNNAYTVAPTINITIKPFTISSARRVRNTRINDAPTTPHIL